jgi:hypothetical protein
LERCWRSQLGYGRVDGERYPSHVRGSCLAICHSLNSRFYPHHPEEVDDATQRRSVKFEFVERARLLGRLAAGPHGFAALRPGGGAAAPELQQLLAFTLQPALDNLANCYADLDFRTWDERHGSVVPQLAARLSPPLLTCLLADVAVGLLCPGCAAARVGAARGVAAPRRAAC